MTGNGDTIIMSRNCHKSAYHGAFLNQLEIKYLFPRVIDKFGIQGGVAVRELEAILKDSESVAAVFIVSPTYDGVVSDIKGFSEICHAYQVPLIVDEAHGAHFRYGEMFPASALDLGADVVVQSLHKTLPSFTQTALLHVKKGYIDIEKIEYYLQIFQSSSPSYLFLAGMERCVQFMEAEGKTQMKEFENHLTQLRKNLKGMKHFTLFDKSIVGSWEVFDLDESKVVVSTRGTGLSGRQFMDKLRLQYHLEMEMCGADYVTAITSVMDTKQGLKRLEDALMAIDREIGEYGGTREDGTLEERTIGRIKEGEGGREGSWVEAVSELTLYQAWNGKKKRVPIADSEGRISGEFVYLYPPGIPLIVPGEIITEDAIAMILSYREKGLPIQGLKDYKTEWIQVLEKQISCGIL